MFLSVNVFCRYVPVARKRGLSLESNSRAKHFFSRGYNYETCFSSSHLNSCIYNFVKAGEGTTYFKSEIAGQDLPFSDAALVGNTFIYFWEGGVIPGTRTVPEDPKEEARLMMEDFKTTLERVDMSMNDLVYVTVYCTDLNLYSDFNFVYRKYFSKDFRPVLSLDQALFLFGLRFEMQGIAVKN